MLHYYSPFKVAEILPTLSALFPGRIDLGLARGGASPEAAAPSADGAPPLAGLAEFEALFERKTLELIAPPRKGRDADLGADKIDAQV